MKKPKSAKNLVQKPYTIQIDYHTPMMEKLVQEKGFTSHSEVVRRGIESIYEHFFPPYRQETFSTKIKREKHEKDKTLKEITPEEFAASINAPVRKNTEGFDMAFVYFGEWKKPTPVALKQLQQYFKQFPTELDVHLARLKSEGPVEEKLVPGEEYSSNFGFTSTLPIE